MPSLSAIFFDLDGTLVDSSIGIHNGFTYAFNQLGVPSPDAKTIRGFMGPPLETSFASCLPQNQIELAVQLYRFYYKDKGVYEAKLFPNIESILSELSKDYPLYITTTKNTSIAENMVRNFWYRPLLLTASMVQVLRLYIRQMSFAKLSKLIT